MADSKLFQITQVHRLHSELIDHPLLELILIGLTSLQVDDSCESHDMLTFRLVIF